MELHPAGDVQRQDRTSPWLKDIAGIRHDHVPGWAPSPCRLPGPVRGYGAVHPRFFTAASATQAPPSERQILRCEHQPQRGRALSRRHRHCQLRQQRKELSICLRVRTTRRTRCRTTCTSWCPCGRRRHHPFRQTARPRCHPNRRPGRRSSALPAARQKCSTIMSGTWPATTERPLLRQQLLPRACAAAAARCSCARQSYPVR